jgi:hypothetical protein
VYRSKLLPVDLTVSVLVPFLALWVYEIANLIALAAQGDGVSLSVAGLIPLGVAGVSQGALSPLTKILQVAMATSLILPLGAMFSKKGLIIAETVVLSTVGVYLASSYWEMLSLLTVVPMTLHTGIFIAGTCTLALVLARELDRPHHFRHPARSHLSNLGPRP